MRIYIVTLNNGFFGSAGASWLSLDVMGIKSRFESAGYEVILTTFSELLSFSFDSNDVVIYTSSDRPVVREFIKDVMYLVSNECTIIPSYQSLMAHENKGFQQLLRDKWGLDQLHGVYYYDLKDVKESPPFVLKQVAGAGSFGVRLIKGRRSWVWYCRKKLLPSASRLIKNSIRWLHLDRSQYSLYEYRYRRFHRVVVQEFISDVRFDYKVLSFWGKFYVLKRGVKPNDFRASGAGILSFPISDVPDAVLDLALKIVGLLDSPIASLDIIYKEGKADLIEFQVTNFGPKALVDSPGYYQRKAASWEFVVGESDLNEEVSRSFFSYLDSKRPV